MKMNNITAEDLSVEMYNTFRNILINYSPALTFEDEVHIRRYSKDCVIAALKLIRDNAENVNILDEVEKEIEIT